MSINPRWQQEEDCLYTEIECDDFMTAIELVNDIAELAEEHEHHPDVCVQRYKYLHITLQTHDSGGVTERDEALAAAIDGLLA